MGVPRIGFWLLCFLLPLGSPLLAFGQEGVFLKEEDAPRAVFPDANSFERRVIPSSEELKQKIQQRMGKTKTSLWEDSYVTFVAKKGEAILGYAVIVEEIGNIAPLHLLSGWATTARSRTQRSWFTVRLTAGGSETAGFLRNTKGKN